MAAEQSWGSFFVLLERQSRASVLSVSCSQLLPEDVDEPSAPPPGSARAKSTKGRGGGSAKAASVKPESRVLRSGPPPAGDTSAAGLGRPDDSAEARLPDDDDGGEAAVDGGDEGGHEGGAVGSGGEAVMGAPPSLCGG